MTTETRLREALSFLQRDGWTKGDAKNAAGELCSVGAIAQSWGAYVAGTDVLWPSTEAEARAQADAIALASVIEEQWPERFVGHLSLFNDHDDTLFIEVERAFEKAALRREEAV